MTKFSPSKFFQVAAISLLALVSIFVPAGCGESAPEAKTAAETAPDTATAPYHRRQVDFYKGIAEPTPTDWDGMVRESDRLLDDGFNAVTLSPPIDITARLGGKPRIILEGQAASAEALTDDFHEKGLAVHISPTTKAAGLSQEVEPTDGTLEHLREDVVRWAQKAEERQAELFSPLSEYNLVLGTEAADRWSREVLPLIRERYHGPVAAKVAADLAEPPAAGNPHDFESLNYRGYDFLMVDIFPRDGSFDAAAFDLYVTDVLVRAAAVAQRDGLKGIMVGEFGAWREPAGLDAVAGPVLGEVGQAEMAGRFLAIAMPRTRGVFFQGWTLPGRGARDQPVEEVLKKNFNPGRAANQ